MSKIAFLGIGLMGDPMVRRLLQAGFNVTAWNRTVAKAEALRDAGARIVATAAEAAHGADVIITMLADGPAVHDVLTGQGVASSASAGSIIVDMSSIKPSEARAHAALLSAHSIGHLDAPVSGGTIGAREGTLAIMVGGSQADFERCAPVFAAMGRATRVGNAGAGQLAKLANQAIVAINIGGVAEALLLAAAGGADPVAVRRAMSGGFADSKVLQVHGARMLERNFVPGGRMRTHIKDLTNILDEADQLGLKLPLVSLMLQLMRHVRDDLAGADFDHSAVLLQLEAMSQDARVGDAKDRFS